MKTVSGLRLAETVADYIFGAEKSIGAGLYSGKMGVSVFLMNLWIVTGKSKYYKRASAMAEDVFDFLTLQSHLYYQQGGDKVDLSFADGCAGILWGLALLTREDWLDCDWEDLAVRFDPAIFSQMVEGIRGKDPDEVQNALGVACYASVRQSRFAREYFYRFQEEWKPRSSALGGGFEEVCMSRRETVLDRLSKEADSYACSGLPPGQWFTSYRGLYRLHYGLVSGLAGIGMALLRNEEYYGSVWEKCLV